MRALTLAALVSTLFLSGCIAMPTQKQWTATGGSRADAVVRLSYEYGQYEQPQVNEQEALDLATARCKSWGYSGAEAFGGVTRQCNQTGRYGCENWLVTKEFQCTGQGDGKKR